MKILLICVILPLMKNVSSVILSQLLSLLCILSFKFFPHNHYPIFIEKLFMFDQTSFYLIVLTFWISHLMTLSFSKDKSNFMFLILSLTSLLVLTFSVNSLMGFYILFELSLIPTMMMIMGFGKQPERVKASIYFLFYTVSLSLPLLVTIMNLSKYWFLYSFYFLYLEYCCDKMFYILLFLVFVPFMVKIPLFILHFWLPKAHVEAPLTASMILAALLLKTGLYGFFRFSPLLNNYNFQYLIISISLVGMVMICIVCLFVTDLKMIIAYGSVNHMNFVISGVLLLKVISMTGGMMMMISHGLTSSLMFFLADLTYKRLGSRSIYVQKAFLSFQPILTLLWLLTVMLNISVPPMLGSFSELMISFTIINWSWKLFMFIIFYMLMSASYSIYLFCTTNYGNYNNNQKFYPISVKELVLSFLHIFPSIISIFCLSLFNYW